MRPDRHSFVWLSPDVPLPELAAEWREEGRPFIVASSRPGDGDDTVRLGLALPGRQRLGLHLPQTALIRVEPAPLLEDLRDVHPPWTRRLDEIVAIARVQAYGSLAWQAMTGLTYLHAGSDIDLLVGPDAGVVDALLALPQDPRLDGEVRLTDGRAVTIREFNAPRWLVKGHGGPWLREAGLDLS
ncbi:phosphoribosyl-dephospho-CoA transferase MdcG domain-containing protein [Falsirhodobacter sp. 1013]|uniref:phosphoribosyl-dephospho-CoA transferase MdcG domain-containing protein n=1 Tax=Falsirhodobacter sp. 1013 TaxID=3417566 RepID=UPI003EB752CF